MYGSESNFDCINMVGNVRLFALHQVRDQMIPNPELNFGSNTSRDNTNG